MGTKFSKPENIMALKLYKDNNEIRIPTVQRDLVWTKSQNQLLIDSLFKDYDIPKIYFREVKEGNKSIFFVVDGQQRLNAIFSFLNDEFELSRDADKFNGENIAGKKYSELSTNLQVIFQARSLDVVHLIDYTDDEIDETFLRLQNGTPLKAAEKRRAISGEMRNVIKELSGAAIFDKKFCDYDNSHYNYEDVSTKVLKQIKDGLGSSSAQALQKFYEDNKSITINDSNCKEVKKAFTFLAKAFKQTTNPHLKKYATLDLTVIVYKLLASYNLNQYPKQFAETYLKFCDERVLNKEKPEEEQDPRLIAYSNSARADSIENVEYRQNFLKNYFLENMPYLVAKDNQRFFTQEQRAVIYRLGNGVCAICGKRVKEDEDYEADHVIPYASGGQTQISNGRLLCSKCNESIGARR